MRRHDGPLRVAKCGICSRAWLNHMYFYIFRRTTLRTDKSCFTV